MSHNAYALYFAVVLIGCAQALSHYLWSSRDDVMAAIRGMAPEPIDFVERLRLIRVERRRAPAFAPVVFSICRI